MSHVADTEDILEQLVGLLNDSGPSNLPCGHVVDKINYSLEYQGLRSYLHEWGMPIAPYTPLNIEIDSEAQLVRVMEPTTRARILTLYNTDEVTYTDMIEDELLDHIWCHHYDTIRAYYNR